MESIDQGLPQFGEASLYIGSLSRDVTEETLYAHFSTASSILSIRICRDNRTQDSLGYGYLNFPTCDDAKRVLDTMNFDVINGHSIRLMWSQRNPSLRKSGIGNIFVKNLDKSIDNKFFYNFFSDYGTIMSCKVVTDEFGESRGYGFVQFENESTADGVIELTNGMFLNNRKIYVGRFIGYKEREKIKRENLTQCANVFVNNFSVEVAEDELKSIFNPYGNILSCKIMIDENGKSKGFGFISFDNPESAQRAIKELNGVQFSGKELSVDCSQEHLELQRAFQQATLEIQSVLKGIPICVKNLHISIDEFRLKVLFSRFGKIINAYIIKDIYGQSRGFGFVSFRHLVEASSAVLEMNGKTVASNPLYVSMALNENRVKHYLASENENKNSLPASINTCQNPIKIDSDFVSNAQDSNSYTLELPLQNYSGDHQNLSKIDSSFVSNPQDINLNSIEPPLQNYTSNLQNPTKIDSSFVSHPQSSNLYSGEPPLQNYSSNNQNPTKIDSSVVSNPQDSNLYSVVPPLQNYSSNHENPAKSIAQYQRNYSPPRMSPPSENYLSKWSSHTIRTQSLKPNPAALYSEMQIFGASKDRSQQKPTPVPQREMENWTTMNPRDIPVPYREMENWTTTNPHDMPAPQREMENWTAMNSHDIPATQREMENLNTMNPRDILGPQRKMENWATMNSRDILQNQESVALSSFDQIRHEPAKMIYSEMANSPSGHTMPMPVFTHRQPLDNYTSSIRGPPVNVRPLSQAVAPPAEFQLSTQRHANIGLGAFDMAKVQQAKARPNHIYSLNSSGDSVQAESIYYSDHYRA